MPGTSVIWERSRPSIPGYGIPESGGEMLDTDDVRGRLELAQNYWIGSVSADGQPHAVPVWAAFVNDALWFGGGPRTKRNLLANPRVSVHLESGSEVVILEGTVTVVDTPDPAVSLAIDNQYAEKYDWRPSTEEDGAVGAGWFCLVPAKILAWTRFPADATRWTRRSTVAIASVSGHEGVPA
jgi:hypothetical protein